LATLNDLHVGERVGNYTLVRKVGQGGLGEVWLAHHAKLAHKPMVAIKFVLYPRSQELERFEREVEMLDLLRQSQHIIQAEDYGEYEGKPYLVMQYAPGGDLSSRLKKGLALTTIATYLEQIASGLDYAHAKGIIHRDLKPNNILFSSEDTVLLADFGIAHEENYELTDTGIALGTVEYMAPEQFTDARRVTTTADIYSLGVIAFQLVTKKLPFGHRGQGKTPYQLMHEHCTAPIPQLSLYNPNLPPDLQAVIERAMAKKPEARYASAGEFAADFRAALSGIATQSENHVTVMGSVSPVDSPILSLLNELPPLPTAITTPLTGHKAPSVPEPKVEQPVAETLGATQALSPSPNTLVVPLNSNIVLADPLLFKPTTSESRNFSPWVIVGLVAVIIFLMSIALVLAVMLVVPLNKNANGTPTAVTSTPHQATSTASITTGPVSLKIKVPDVTRKTRAEAEEAISNARLAVGEVKYDYSSEVEIGRVISTVPKAGTDVDAFSKVGLLISRGRKP
jgi:serine/threonine protein kinase